MSKSNNGEGPDLTKPGMAYVSKNEKKIPIDDPSGKWSDLCLLPEWGDDTYDVYTVRKHGKWVMLKALRKELADDPAYKKKLSKEFDVRYNLCHPNIVMINDLEQVPGVGMAIVTDDTYGYSLRRLIDERRLTPKIVHRLQTQLLDAMEYIQENHIQHKPISPETIIFTEYNENLKLTDVGYGQTDSLTVSDTASDIEAYGKIINEVLDHLPASLPRLRKIARKCQDKENTFGSVSEIQLAMEKRSSSQLYVFLCVFIVLMGTLLAWLTLSD